MRRLLHCAGLIAVITSCSPISPRMLNRSFTRTEQKFQDHTGFMLYDLDKRKSVYEYNASSYFTPASNTKIFTFYTALSVIGDSIPALKYVQRGDSLIFWGTGDPSLLSRNVYSNNSVLSVLTNAPETLYFSSSNFHTTHFGPGWAWDDYNDYYSAERSPLPLYGNILYVENGISSLIVRPSYFKKLITYEPSDSESSIVRNVDSNLITMRGRINGKVKKEIPIRMSGDLITQLLTDTLKKPVKLIDTPLVSGVNTLYSLRADSLYRVMMQDSDNFIAEQLLLITSGILTDTLKTEIAINYSKTNLLNDLPDEPIWIDGSGLSRYNLFTPRSIVRLWEKIYDKVPEQRLFALLATGGKAGTIRNWYKADTPFIFGKTGSLSNNHCLSGYLVTRSGKRLIFSFMNSNFTASSNDIRRNMQSILNQIYEKY